MCGIAGIINADHSPTQKAKLKISIKRMTDSIAHRGPDGEGFWQDEKGTLALGHRRLSVLDLSHEADQPMHYLERYVIIFNGEIYNFIELRKKLQQQGHQFRTTGDTELLLVLYHIHKEKLLKLLDGMFAFAIYDKLENDLFCARDRFGEKPFFYSYVPGKQFVFGSEMKAIKAYTGDHDINNRMVYNYLSFGSLDNKNDPSETFFTNIKRLPHSHYLKVDLDTLKIDIKRYWNIEIGNINHSITMAAAKETLHELFYMSVKYRMRSDVNIGSSLSGGLDSSLIVCVIDDLLKNNKTGPGFNAAAFKQKTFSARFPGFKKDEGSFMKMVTDSCNVEPHYVFPTDKNLAADIDNIFTFQEEPFGGNSILVQYEVMKLAREHDVTVLLDGQGADEILAGYHGYYNPFFRTMERQGKRKYKAELNAYLKLHSNNQVNKLQEKNMEYRIRKWFPGQMNNIKKTVAYLKHKRRKIINDDFFAAYSGDLFLADESFGDLNEALYRSTMMGDLQILLRYADRNSMANSREVRLPFLSHELVNFLFTLPPDFKIHNGWTKYIMRETFQDVMPPAISWRVDKIGYEPPEKQWMKNPGIRDSIMAARELLIKQGILDKKILLKAPGKEFGNEWADLMIGKLIKS